jgi:hypothetical protein
MLAVSTRAGPSRLFMNSLSVPRAAGILNHERSSSAGAVRAFSSSVAHGGHYETLGVPKGASKAQITVRRYIARCTTCAHPSSRRPGIRSAAILRLAARRSHDCAQMRKKFYPDINDTPDATAKLWSGMDVYVVLAHDR